VEATSPQRIKTSRVSVQPTPVRTETGGTSNSSVHAFWPSTPEAWFSKAKSSTATKSLLANGGHEQASCDDGQLDRERSVAANAGHKEASYEDGQLDRALWLPQSQPSEEAYAVSGEAVKSPGCESTTEPSDSIAQDSGTNKLPERSQCAPQQQQHEPLHDLHLQLSTIEDAECPPSDAEAVHDSRDGAELVDTQAATSTSEVRTRQPTSMASFSLWSWCSCNKVDLPSRSRSR